ncbi:MAG: DNA cytosine methyltransferase, partial [Phycisphaerae bacterium]
YAETYAANHPHATVFNSSVEEVSWEALKRFRPLGLMTMGIPCEPYSVIRRLDRGGQVKRDKALPPEAHELGDMFFWGLRAIEACNPHTVIIEEVPPFLTSAAGFVTIQVLKRFGYNVEGKIIDPSTFGEITGRKRTVIIATMGDIHWPGLSTCDFKLGDILDPEPLEWFNRVSKPWVFNHWETQTAKGNGFAPPILTAQDSKVPTIKKRYFAGQGDNPVVGHPTIPGNCRWLTINEVKRIQGLPQEFILPASKTTAREIMGQGVVVSLFRKIIKAATGCAPAF